MVVNGLKVNWLIVAIVVVVGLFVGARWLVPKLSVEVRWGQCIDTYKAI